jgi:hypothetical protein
MELPGLFLQFDHGIIDRGLAQMKLVFRSGEPVAIDDSVEHSPLFEIDMGISDFV